MNNDKKYFQGLNQNQVEAVKSTEGYVRIIAGAGSGKTRVLANRYAYIVENLGISPNRILCVTFTNRAAREMKNRIQKLLSKEPVNDFICTFHSFCVKVLREDINKLNYPKSFTILDLEDQKAILREVYQNLKISYSTVTYQTIIKEIQSYKNLFEDTYINEYIVKPKRIKINLAPSKNKKSASLIKKIIVEYIKTQKKYFSLDFDDLMLFTLYIFKHFDDVLKRWQTELEYIMVDETQDNSAHQWQLADLVSQINKNLFVVGDPDQSIYEWRGARPDNLILFDTKYQPCKTIILNQNYRSYKNILDVANSVIEYNRTRISKNMFTEKKEMTKAIHFHGTSDKDEAEWVVGKIKKRLDENYDINKIAILFRASYISRSFEQSLINHNIPYVIYGGIRFFERKEIKDTLAYLKTIAIGDDISFRRIINIPSRKIGKVYMEKLTNISNIERTSLYDSLKSHPLLNLLI